MVEQGKRRRFDVNRFRRSPQREDEPIGIHWTYQQLLQRLQRIIIDHKQISLAEFPTSTIDFGEIATQTQALAVAQSEDPVHAERAQLFAISKARPYQPISSSVTIGDVHLTAGLSPKKVFAPEIAREVSQAFWQHSHLFGVFSPNDITIPQISPFHAPGVSVGIPSTEYGPGFTLYAIRSAETPLTIPTIMPIEIAQFILATSKQEHLQYLLSTYPNAMQTIFEIQNPSNGPTRPANDYTPEEASTINDAYDTILRGEAKKNNMVIFVAPFGSTLARRCDLNQPILDQLTPQ